MVDLTTKDRKTLPSNVFGLPGERKYPMPDKAHAINAKARASEMERAGKLSAAAKAEIDAHANRVIKGKK